MDQERDRMQPVQSLRPHQRVDLALGRDAAHDRKMVPRLPLVDDRRPSSRAVGLDHAGQQVDPDSSTKTSLRRSRRASPATRARTSPATAIASSSRWIARVIGTCGSIQVLEQPRHLALAVCDAELLLDDTSDPAAGPEAPPKAISLGTVPEEIGDQTHLVGGQLGSHASPVGVRGERSGPPRRADASHWLTALSVAPRAAAMSR